MEPIRFAARFDLEDPHEGKLDGTLWGFFDGTVGDPAMASWLGAKLRLRVVEAIYAVGPTPKRALDDKDALGRALDHLLVDDYQECAAAGRAVIEGVSLKSEAKPLALVAAPPPRPVVPAMPPPTRVVLDIDPMNVTADAVSPFAMGAPLPFAGKRAAPPPGAPIDDAGEISGDTIAPEDEDAGFPFDEDHPELTVEQYASLCVERALAPQAQVDAAKRYRILTEQALVAVDRHWRRRFDEEGALYRRWQEAYAQYEAWIRAQKK
jgi:hypothetical protein